MNGGTIGPRSRVALVAAMRGEASYGGNADDPGWAETERRLLAALDRTPDGTILEVREDFMMDDVVPEAEWTDHEQIAGSLEYFGIPDETGPWR